MAGSLEFYLDGSKLESGGRISREFFDHETDHVTITAKNCSPRQIHSMHLDTNLPIDFELPQVIMPNEEASITLIINGDNLLDFIPDGEPKLDFKWKELIR